MHVVLPGVQMGKNELINKGANPLWNSTANESLVHFIGYLSKVVTLGITMAITRAKGELIYVWGMLISVLHVVQESTLKSGSSLNVHNSCVYCMATDTWYKTVPLITRADIDKQQKIIHRTVKEVLKVFLTNKLGSRNIERMLTETNATGLKLKGQVLVFLIFIIH